MHFDYRVSIIIPVYNVEDFLSECLDSVISQTIDKNEMEVILVDDGSTDSSPSICKTYCEKYSFLKYFRLKNSGVSNARNFGINNAKGKYFLYLDSDDTLSKETVKNIVDFFDKVYDEVDLVTYYMQPHKNGIPLPAHKRYDKILTETGIYDLEEEPYIVQVTMNICVKNLGENNLYFNTEMTKQEDQEYINRVLMDKMKLGFCADACYYYNRSNEGSAVATTFYAYYLFEDTMKYFEDLFANFEDEVPKYFQAVFFHDLRWKLTSRILYPFHYDKEKFELAVDRIKRLLARVDVSTIVKYPWISKKHIFYWLSMKPNAYPIPYVSKNLLSIVVDGTTIQKKDKFTIKIMKIEQIENGCFNIRCIIGEGIYNFMDEDPEIYAVENGESRKTVTVFPSKFCYHATNTRTNRVFAFNYIVDPKEVSSVSFVAVVDGFEFHTPLAFTGKAVFRHSIKRYSYARGNCIISYNRNYHSDSFSDSIHFKLCSKDEIYAFEKEQIEKDEFTEPLINDLKLQAVDYRYNHKVWLYSDLATVEKDNAYYQFINDFSKDDGIERYYVYTCPYEKIKHLFTDEQKEYLVEFGSQRHTLLYLASDILISSFFGRDSISPFETEEGELNYYDIEHFKIVYMQHGVLHASFVEKYSGENGQCDKIVVSSNFEVKNFSEKYAYREEALIKTGMPRYEFIDKNAAAKNKILLAPSWRSYLAQTVSANKYYINKDSFKRSDYYIKFNEFLNDKSLKSLLEKENICLDVKMHPIISGVASNLFDIKCDNIKFVSGSVNLSDYKAFITDFSSFVFDYAYLCRPVLYFVPDYPQFLSGMNLYRHLDLDFKDAFGAFVTEVEDAVKEVEKIFSNNFVPEKVYKERMENFYLPMDNCRDNIYTEIKKYVDSISK